MAGMLGSEESDRRGLLGDLVRRKVMAQALMAGPEDMSASVDTIPADSGFLSKLANALATMPTVQSIKEMVQYPTQVARGEKQVPQTFAPEAGAAGDEAVGWALGNAVLPSVAMGIPRAFMSNPGRSAEFGIFGGRGAKRAYHGSPHEELARALGSGGSAVESRPMAMSIRPRDGAPMEAYDHAFGNVKSFAQEGHLYRGMTQAEFENTVGSGRGIKSTGAHSHSSEGTSFTHEPEVAESYVNFGRDDPRKTGKPNYIVEVRGQDGFYRDRDGYFKSKDEVSADRITRIWKMHDNDGEVVATLVQDKTRR
jgi:hypothetical protein